jgi:hypothetical protein
MEVFMRRILALTIVWFLHGCAAPADSADPLPSWNDGKAKRAIVEFVGNVTKPGSPDFVPPAQRIATFDNDGTLWAEQPLYFQVQFALDRVKAMAPDHPEWKNKEPFNHLLAGDMVTFMAGGKESVMAVMAASHSGMTTDEFDANVKGWLSTATHSKTGRPYTKMVYQPMLELLAYLRGNGIQTFIGRRPIAAFGNSDGDLQMLQWTAAAPGARFALIVHHDDAEREWAYDRESHIAKLDRALDEATAKGWTVVSIKNDWKTIFPE